MKRREVVNLVASDDECEVDRSSNNKETKSFQEQLALCRQQHERRYQRQVKLKGITTCQSKWKPFYLLQIDERHITSTKYNVKDCVKFSDLFIGNFHTALLGNFMICLIKMYEQCPRLFRGDVETYFIHGIPHECTHPYLHPFIHTVV